jgi:hypothetical protein
MQDRPPKASSPFPPIEGMGGKEDEEARGGKGANFIVSFLFFSGPHAGLSHHCQRPKTVVATVRHLMKLSNPKNYLLPHNNFIRQVVVPVLTCLYDWSPSHPHSLILSMLVLR